MKMAAMNGKKTKDDMKLVDQFGRLHNYLRISITEGCNFSCTYCMPNGYTPVSDSSFMTAQEIGEIAHILVSMGINKIRITGGEPLVRRDFSEIITILGQFPVSLALTTNGYLLNKHLSFLKDNGCTNLNISLDTLHAMRFWKVTGRHGFQDVIKSIEKALKMGFQVKLNTVVMKGVNDDEIIDFARLTIDNPLTTRFIEFMPFPGNRWKVGHTINYEKILQKLKNEFELLELKNESNQTSNLYNIKGAQGKIGIIGTVSNPFCSGCNRIRLTADGMIKNCLFNNKEFNVLEPLRKGEEVKSLIFEALNQKNYQYGGKLNFNNPTREDLDNRAMYSIGG